MIDRCYVAGRIVQPPELRYTVSGTPVLKIRCAQSASRFDDATQKWVRLREHFFDVVVWPAGKNGEINAPAALNGGLKQGDEIVVHGEWNTREYKAKDGYPRSVTEFVARQVYLDALTALSGVDEAPPQDAGSPPWG